MYVCMYVRMHTHTHTHTHQLKVLTDVEMSLTIALGPSDNWVSLTPAIHFPLSTSDSHFAIRRARLAVLARTFALPSPLAITLSGGLETTRMQLVCVCVLRSRLTPYSHDLHSI